MPAPSSVPMDSRLFLNSLRSHSFYLVLCSCFQSTWIWVFGKTISMDQFTFLCMQTSNYARTIFFFFNVHFWEWRSREGCYCCFDAVLGINLCEWICGERERREGMWPSYLVVDSCDLSGVVFWTWGLDKTAQGKGWTVGSTGDMVHGKGKLQLVFCCRSGIRLWLWGGWAVGFTGPYMILLCQCDLAIFS